MPNTPSAPAAGQPRRVFLLPPPGLPVPAVKGGAVETLITHLIEENERQGLLWLECASIPDPDAMAAAAGWKHTRMHWIAPASPLARRLYGPLRGLALRLGRELPQDPWYLAAAKRLRQTRPNALVAEGGNLTEPARIRRQAGLARQACFVHLHMQTPCTPLLEEGYGAALGISEFVLGRWQPARLPCQKHLVYNCVDLARFCPAWPESALASAPESPLASAPEIAPASTPARADASDPSHALPGAAPAQPPAAGQPAGTPAAQAPPNPREALRAALGLAPDDFAILFCGRICPEKGVHKLVRAMTLLPGRFKLVVVGSPFFAAADSSPFFEELKALSAPLIAAGRVRFTGFVHNSRLPDHYRAADAAVLPALWDEPAGITAIEAMACGCPVIAADSGGMPEYLAGSGAVLLRRDERIADDGSLHAVPGVPPLDKAIAEALLALAADEPRRNAMAKAGAERAKAFGRAEYYRQFCRALGAGC